MFLVVTLGECSGRTRWSSLLDCSLIYTTTKIESYPCAIGSLVIKSTDICVQGFSGIELGINLPTGCSVWFLFL